MIGIFTITLLGITLDLGIDLGAFYGIFYGIFREKSGNKIGEIFKASYSSKDFYRKIEEKFGNFVKKGDFFERNREINLGKFEASQKSKNSCEKLRKNF